MISILTFDLVIVSFQGQIATIMPYCLQRFLVDFYSNFDLGIFDFKGLDLVVFQEVLFRCQRLKMAVRVFVSSSCHSQASCCLIVAMLKIPSLWHDIPIAYMDFIRN